jgi:hypothetical protein
MEGAGKRRCVLRSRGENRIPVKDSGMAVSDG